MNSDQTYVQQYFAERDGYRCGRCGTTKLKYAGQPHHDATNQICEPANDLATRAPQPLPDGPTATGALAPLGEQTAPDEDRRTEVDQPPEQPPEETGTAPAAAATLVVGEQKDFPKIKPLSLDENGDVQSA